MRDFLAGLLARFQAADRQQRLYVALGVVVAVFVLRFGVTWLILSSMLSSFWLMRIYLCRRFDPCCKVA